GGVDARPPVALLLHQAGADQRLITGDEDALLRKVVFVVEGDVLQRHCAGLREAGVRLSVAQHALVPRFGSSSYMATTSSTNFGTDKGTSKCTTPVPLIDLKFVNELAAGGARTSNRRH